MCAFARIFLALSLWLTFIGQAPASVLDSIIEQIPTAPLIRGQYTQTQKLVHVPKPFVTHGHFVFWRDSVFLWKTQDKIPTSTVYSEHSFKTYFVSLYYTVKYVKLQKDGIEFYFLGFAFNFLLILCM